MAELTFEVDDTALKALANNPTTLRRVFNKFIESLIRHYLRVKKNEELPILFDYGPAFVIPLYIEPAGNAVCLLLSIIEREVDNLFQGVKEQIKYKDRLRVFMSRLADNFCGRSTHHLLYFIAIVVRIFMKSGKPGRYTMVEYVEIVSDVVERHKGRIVLKGGFTGLNQLVTEIARNPQMVNDFRGINCGQASDYI